MSSSDNYAVECTKCSEGRSADNFELVRDFAFTHQKHTGHPVSWTETSIDAELSAILDLVYRIECDECEEFWEFENETEAENFFEQHESITDHSPSDMETFERALKVNKPDDLLKLIDRLNTRTEGEDGAPYDIIIKAARHRGGNIEKVKKWIKRLSQQGALYEPTSNYYRHI